MKLTKLNCNNTIGFYLEFTKHVNLGVYFLKRLRMDIDFKTTVCVDRQITELTFLNVYVQFSTPICLLWVTEKELMSFALDTLKNRANDLEDNFAEFLLGDSNKIDYDEQVELSILYQVINFYGSNNNDERGTGR